MTMTDSQPTELQTLTGGTVTVNGIGYVDGFLQLALHGAPGEPIKTMFMYQMKCNKALCQYLEKTWDCWAKDIFKQSV
tara:strand:+ start:3023 stop:3256 length:234 start_codon:yes stop_codon:yes gene_type:complete